LIDETSPYLLQHAYNPVDWYPWGTEALDRAHRENKPIFLSVGYSACHWCHVMEHESFENEEVGRALNEHFVPVKVDREERPDLDDIYMAAVQAMAGNGGWPMSVFLTPEGKPFFAGTYFPREDRHGRPGFLRVVTTLARAWQEDEKKTREHGEEVARVLREQLDRELPEAELPSDILRVTVMQLESELDREEGGFGEAPKFPSSMALDLYVDLIRREGGGESVDALREHLQLCLRKMAQGGIYDQVAGGFCRYSTDARWYVPHFEKMLYDNALLARTYLDASQVVDAAFNRRIGCEILDYVLREMTHPQGAFYATTDADSEGLEGKFFLWTREQIHDVLGAEDGRRASDVYGIAVERWHDVDFPGGTPPHDWFAGRIPALAQDLEVMLERHEIAVSNLDAWREALWAARAQRVPPARDEKVLSSWNGLMATAFATGYRVTGDRRYLEAARRNVDFLWDNLQHACRLHATWKDRRARHLGTLEDYANVVAACLSLHQIGAGRRFLDRAHLLTDTAIRRFEAGEGKAFYYTADDAEHLIVRSKNAYDNAVPGANSVLAGNLLRLGRLLGRDDYVRRAQGIFREFSAYMRQAPRAFPWLIREYAAWLDDRRELVLVGADGQLHAQVLAAIGPHDCLLTEDDADLPLLRGRSAESVAVLYVCKDGRCDLPVRGNEAIRARLGRVDA
jgi:uncharacterized protein YyaL (SSP411 family)